MAYINNIVRKKNRPAKIWTIILCCLLACGVRYIDKKNNPTPATRSITENETSDSEYLMYLVIAISICTLCLYINDLRDQEKSKDLAFRFIMDDFIEDYPEAKQYITVLQNSESLNIITNTICNELDKEEQKKIIRIAHEFEKNDTEQEYSYNFHIVRREITEIVHSYSQRHQGYAQIIKKVLSNEHKTYIANIRNNIR